jgi:hypothetical protein
MEVVGLEIQGVSVREHAREAVRDLLSLGRVDSDVDSHWLFHMITPLEVIDALLQSIGDAQGSSLIERNGNGQQPPLSIPS